MVFPHCIGRFMPSEVASPWVEAATLAETLRVDGGLGKA